ncbi:MULTISPECIES: acyl-CoA dehydrogenase family protein [Streptomyces]|uniref:Acyl-CoA dehydrogenase family protein n=1 Tax=Streptomyces incanus TaxID=887453 RepID=A0ABW0Y1D8_9ACTN|nr:acyl-CoA dehydrogenase family protein [Streptomyces hirsutus]
MTPEQQALVSTVQALLGKRAASAAVRKALDDPAGFDSSLWEVLVEQIGAAALTIPEEFGGADASLVEAALVLEELGRSLAPTPLIAGVIAAEALLAAPESDLRNELLGRIAAGAVATVVQAGPTLYAGQAEILLAVDGDRLLLVDAADVTMTPAMDQTIQLATVVFDPAAATPVSTGAEAAAVRARRAARIGAAALATGAAQRALDVTVSYAKERHQFGRPIGSFQALKHRMADMLVLVETSRSATWAAAAGDIKAEVAASYATEAALKTAGEMIQLLGGIAITWEHDAHLIFKRTQALTQLFGQPHELRAGLLDADAAAPADAGVA